MRPLWTPEAGDALVVLLTTTVGLMIIVPVTLLLSLLLPFALRPLLVRLGIMDVPNERSSHERPVVRGLGLAVLIAMTVAGAIGLYLLLTPPASEGWLTLGCVVAGSLAAGLLGFSEDLRGLSVRVRGILLLGIAAATAAALLWDASASERQADLASFLAERYGDGLLYLQLPLGWIALNAVGMVLLGVYAVLFISSYINVANFMDGLNGISGFHGVIAGATFAFAGFATTQTWLVFAGTALALAFAGFLPWNLAKPGAFLGDVGSYLLGGAVAITSFAALVSGVPILATIGPMVIYFGDVGVTLVKRVRGGHKWDEPHKEHVYQRLQQRGLSHIAASGITALFTLAASVLGLASFFVAPVWWLALLAGGLALVVLYMSLPRLLARR